MMLASVTVTLVLIVVAALGGAVGLYFFLRNNPNKKAKIDAEVNKVTKSNKTS